MVPVCVDVSMHGETLFRSAFEEDSFKKKFLSQLFILFFVLFLELPAQTVFMSVQESETV